jgi:hypothetical protein
VYPVFKRSQLTTSKERLAVLLAPLEWHASNAYKHTTNHTPDLLPTLLAIAAGHTSSTEPKSTAAAIAAPYSEALLRSGLMSSESLKAWSSGGTIGAETSSGPTPMTQST